MSKRVVFKCSFGERDGWGHVVRCSALAQEFLDRSWETFLWSEGNLLSLPEEIAKAFTGVQEHTAVESDILVVDEMYTPQERLEAVVEEWRGFNRRGIVAGVDDMQRRSMAGFDLVLNTEIGLAAGAYQADVSLLGESFALLRSGFRRPAELTTTHEFVGHTPVLVMIGGTDAFGFLPRVLEALSDIGSTSIAPVVVSPHEVDLQAFGAGRALRRISSAEMAAWMRFCSLGIIGCGSSLYEAAAMELPFVGLSIVDNQTATARKVQSLWGMPVYHFEESEAGDLRALAGSVQALLVRDRVPYSKVDTKGASRVVDALEVLLAKRSSR